MKPPSNLISRVLALLAACTFPAAVIGADNSPAPQAIVGDSASTDKPPIVVQNPDGTITVQKEPAKGRAEDAKTKKGLVIRPQVVIPIIPARQKRN
jgi:hypothetical protein